MPQLTVKRLLIYIAFLFFLNGCGSVGTGGSNSDASSSGVSVVPKGDGSALVSWVPPTQNTDGSPLTDLAGFKIYYGTFPGEYEEPEIVTNPGMSSFLVEGLGEADWFFVMTAFNTSGIESAYSDEVFKTIN